MAHETITKSQRFYCVSVYPDICKTPVGNAVVLIPYTIKGEFVQAQAVSPNVKTHSEPMFLHGRSFIPSVTGDEPGKLGGWKSGTFTKRVESFQTSSTKGANGTHTIQEGRFVWMNDRNTVGRVMERGVKPARPRITVFGVDVPEPVQDAAKHYLENISGPLHEGAGKAMNVGGDIIVGSGVVAGAGLVVTATGVGAPVGLAMEGGAAAGATVGSAVSGVGAVTDATATGADAVATMLSTGKTPDMVGVAMKVGEDFIENVVIKKAGSAFNFVKRLASKKVIPGNTPASPAKPPDKAPAADKGGKDHDGRDGGKTVKPKEQKGDKPSDCCPKNAAPGGKKTSTRKPVHIGTGEEVLYQSDFVLAGPTPLEWGRTYRSGSESEDWGMLGARWATPFTASLSVCAKGVVYHEETGRALRLPVVGVGQEHDNRSEGFVLRCHSDSHYSLIWRDGSVDTFRRVADAVLPHGYDGVNAMLAPRSPAQVQRYAVECRTKLDGSGWTVERHEDAAPGDVLLRVRTHEGLALEALREHHIPDARTPSDLDAPARIGRIEQVLDDGTRICHVSYRYEAAAKPDDTGSEPAPFDALPQRWYLVTQTNVAGSSRTYSYQHCLLLSCTNYSGFAHHLEWGSLELLRERWSGNGLDDAQLARRHPVTQDNSYRARVFRVAGADGSGANAFAYIDHDTTCLTEADGGVLEYTFNAQWLATDVRRVGPDGIARSLGRREWDKDGMLLSDTDGAHNATRYTYDAAGNLTSVTNALGNVTRIDYDAFNRPVSVTDALGHRTRSGYDDAGRIVNSTDELGRITAYSYDGQGRLAVLTDARGGAKRLSYDGAGRLASYTDCSGYTSLYQYDGQNRLVNSVDAVGNASRYSYDGLGRMVGVTHPDKTTETFDYDGDNNLTRHTDAKGQMTSYRYNSHGLPVERIDAKGQTMRYRHDEALRLVELVNGNDDSYRFTYDEESRLLTETGFDSKTTQFSYDGAGLLVSSTCDGVRTDYLRDSMGQLVARNMSDGDVRYAYDALGRLTAVASQRAEQRFGYDAAGQLVDERVAYALGQLPLPGEPRQRTAAFTLTHAYDMLGNRIQSTLPNGRTVDTLRYGSGHWHGTLWQGTALVDLERDHLHRETARQVGTGRDRLHESRAYDPQSRLSAFTLTRGNERLRERRYEYDATGNLTRIADQRGGDLRYAYDPLGQLLSALREREWSETFAFDPAGNLLDPPSRKDGGIPHETEELRIEKAQFGEQARHGIPRLAKVTHNLLRQYAGHLYDYDARGNVIGKRSPAGDGDGGGAQALALVYDSENRLITATRTNDQGRQVAHYTYDAFGRRIAKEVSEERREANGAARPFAVKTTLFVWDGDVLAQEIHADKTVTYLYEPDSFVPLARIESSEGVESYAPPDTHLCHINEWELPDARNNPPPDLQQQEADKAQGHWEVWTQRQKRAGIDAVDDRIHYYQCDHLGTPLDLLNEDGVSVWSGRYKAWGRILRYSANDVEQPLRFQGQYEDAETGLYYNRYRYYDPDCARYITQDPIGLNGGTNLYQYSPNPTAWVDPLGLAAGKDCCCPKLLMLNPKDINFAQRSVNSGFDIPGGKISMEKAIRLGAAQVAEFPPISVINVKGQWVARDGNSRLLIARKTKAKQIAALDESSCEDKRKDLSSRLRNNGLERSGTNELPVAR
ncbi:DUF4150 domain-containing protein [Massilia sp. CCM 8695]|uniref:DUF4150 domain-containing protein n=1 Tax=Massilia frigida TaxID=2609281 RepID=A0ABX0NFA4_9BURK|nr:RHS repeat-associated core domain-containing protein [Massilia frigida]NHZ83844.1 DUF4150 domain-containing protein [Massilia frigida]